MFGQDDETKTNQGLDNLFSSNSDFLTLLAKKEEKLEKQKPVEESIKESSQPKEEKQEETKKNTSHDDDREFLKLKQEFGKEFAQVLPSPKKFAIEKEEDEDKTDFFGTKKDNFSDLLGGSFNPAPKSFQKQTLKDDEDFLEKTSLIQAPKEEKKAFLETKRSTEPPPSDDFNSFLQKKPQEMYREENKYVDYQQQFQTKNEQKRFSSFENYSPKEEKVKSFQREEPEEYERKPMRESSGFKPYNQEEVSEKRYSNDIKRVSSPEYVQKKSEDKLNIEALKKFPGPIKNKEDIVKFIEEKVDTNINMNERQLWSLLYIFSSYKNEEEIITAIRKLISKEINESNEKVNSGFKSKNRPKGEIEKDIMFMQKLLMNGNIEEGCNYAMDNGLWAHALLLSSMIDKKTYQKVVVKFATSAFYDGSPMQTLYLMFAEKGEFIFQSSEEMNLRENWKDNILIVLSNRTQSSGSILEKLGIKLWNEYGDVFASHFTFLVADYFTKFDITQKLQLIGGENNNSLSNNLIDSIQRTEVFEFYKTLQNPNFIFPKFQEFKFIYAKLLFQNGIVQKSFDYIRSIKEKVSKFPQIFNPKFSEELNNFEKSLLATGKVTEPTTGSWFIDSFTRLLHGDEKKEEQKVEVKQQSQAQQKEVPKPEPKKDVIEPVQSGGGWFSWLPFSSGKREINFGKPNAFEFKDGKWKRDGQSGNGRSQERNEPPPELNGPPILSQTNQPKQTSSYGGYVDLFNTGAKKEEKKYQEIEEFTPQINQSKPKSSFFKPPSVQNKERDYQWEEEQPVYEKKIQKSPSQDMEMNTMKKVPSQESNWMEKGNYKKETSPNRSGPQESFWMEKKQDYEEQYVTQTKKSPQGPMESSWINQQGPDLSSSWMEKEGKKSNGPPEGSWMEKEVPKKSQPDLSSSWMEKQVKNGPPEGSWMDTTPKKSNETKKSNGPPIESSWMDKNGPPLPSWEMK